MHFALALKHNASNLPEDILHVLFCLLIYAEQHCCKHLVSDLVAACIVYHKNVSSLCASLLPPCAAHHGSFQSLAYTLSVTIMHLLLPFMLFASYELPLNPISLWPACIMCLIIFSSLSSSAC